MPIRPTSLILEHALDGGYGVAAFNIVNDLTLEAVIAAAEEVRSPLIVQTSVKTVKSIGRRRPVRDVPEMAGPASVPVTLHLDHCPERAVITDLPRHRAGTRCSSTGRRCRVDENTRGRRRGRGRGPAVGAHVEGEIEGIRGVEDGIGSDEEGEV